MVFKKYFFQRAAVSQTLFFEVVLAICKTIPIPADFSAWPREFPSIIAKDLYKY